MTPARPCPPARRQSLAGLACRLPALGFVLFLGAVLGCGGDATPRGARGKGKAAPGGGPGGEGKKGSPARGPPGEKGRGKEKGNRKGKGKQGPGRPPRAPGAPASSGPGVAAPGADRRQGRKAEG